MLKQMVSVLYGTLVLNGWQGSAPFNEQSVYFPIRLSWQNEQVTIPAMVDTGAYMMVIPAKVASELKLKNDGSIISSGIGGSETEYKSLVNIRLGGKEFDGIPCEVSSDTTIVWFDMGTMRYLGVSNININLNTDKVTLTGV